jgi:hypothetical protein
MGTVKAIVFAGVSAFLVVFAVHFLDFPGSVPRFEALSRGGVLLDVSPSFTVDAIYERLSGYGEAGRQSYSFRNVTVDFLLPLSLLPFLFLLMRKAITSLRLSHFLRVSLLVVPFAYVLFDLAENAAVLVLLVNYPERLNFLARALPYVTSVKRVASLLAIFAPLLIFGARFLRGKFHRAEASVSLK